MRSALTILLSLLAINTTRIPSATLLLDSVSNKYASCAAYRDTGTVRQVLPGGEKTWTFSTSFDRRGEFRLEFRTGRDTYAAWTDHGRAYRSWTVDRQTLERRSIAEAIGEAAGISGGMSTIVPSLLGRGITPSLLTRLTDVRNTGTSIVGGVTCSVIEGLDRGNRPARVYVGVDDHLIHRVVRTQPELAVTTTIDYTPRAVITR
jgi:hypothetical protein